MYNNSYIITNTVFFQYTGKFWIFLKIKIILYYNMKKQTKQYNAITNKGNIY